IIPKYQFILAQSIKVTEILLDATEHRIRTVFSKLKKIVRLTIDTKNLWQQATITFSADSNFNNIKKGHKLFVFNNMVRYHICDLPKKDILAKSKFSAKLAELSRFTTGK
ncbi:2947_t:CDS:1, partial [Funneliformis geosporum]